MNSFSTLSDQYRKPDKLYKRISLHQRFSTNPYGWHRWVFDQFEFPHEYRILELGCGPGSLWIDNLDRIPSGWQIVLTDFSQGMLTEVQLELTGKDSSITSRFSFNQVDASTAPLPFSNLEFDAVIANHMLYHIPDRNSLFAEIQRLLKPDGFFFASTVGIHHLVEINQLLVSFDAKLSSWSIVSGPFNLENGAYQLSDFFEKIELRRYNDSLFVTEPDALIEFICSGWCNLPSDRMHQFRNFIYEQFTKSGGALSISKDSGMFIGIKKLSAESDDDKPS